MQLKQRAQQGFTLIELMIVVAIIGILAAVAIPQYRDYTTKSKAGSGISSVDGIKKGVAMCYQETAAFTDCAPGGTFGVPSFTATNVVSGVTYSATTGAITLTFATGVSGDLDGKTITFTPRPDGARMSWGVATNVTNTTVKTAIEKNNSVS
jgi:type IV pilus assembly protein PilA